MQRLVFVLAATTIAAVLASYGSGGHVDDFVNAEEASGASGMQLYEVIDDALDGHLLDRYRRSAAKMSWLEQASGMSGEGSGASGEASGASGEISGTSGDGSGSSGDVSSLRAILDDGFGEILASGEASGASGEASGASGEASGDGSGASGDVSSLRAILDDGFGGILSSGEASGASGEASGASGEESGDGSGSSGEVSGFNIEEDKLFRRRRAVAVNATSSTTTAVPTTTTAGKPSTTTTAATTTTVSGNLSCVVMAKCSDNVDCNGGTCIGFFPGRCNCNACINFWRCKDDTQCGGLQGACNTTSNMCKCMDALAQLGYPTFLDAAKDFCNVKQCKANECNGLSCHTGFCSCPAKKN